MTSFDVMILESEIFEVFLNTIYIDFQAERAKGDGGRGKGKIQIGS